MATRAFSSDKCGDSGVLVKERDGGRCLTFEKRRPSSVTIVCRHAGWRINPAAPRSLQILGSEGRLFMGREFAVLRRGWCIQFICINGLIFMERPGCSKNALTGGI